MVDCYSPLKCCGRLLLGALLLALVLVAPAAAQSDLPEFEMDAVSIRAEDGAGTRTDVYTKVPYARLRFINTADGFEASYTVMVEAYRTDRQGRRQSLVERKIWDRSFTVDLYATTQQPELHDRTTQSLDLAPGSYVFVCQIEDDHTNEAFVEEEVVEVRDLSGSVALSSLVLLDEHDLGAGTIVPTVSDRLGTDRTTVELFYEVYARSGRPAEVTREVIRLKGGGPPIMRPFRTRDEALGATAYAAEEPHQLQAGRNPFIVTIPLTDLQAGAYLVRVRLEDPASGRVLAEAERRISAEWSGLATHLRNLDEAVDQLEYIAKRKEVQHIREGRSRTEKLRRFEDFWKKRDPTPATERNERMEEYYYRVTNANRRYGTSDRGWRTDRGYVMVLFGEPDRVERHPYNYNTKPWEAWYYERIGRRFIFVDETGLGDYELLVPVYDERTRIR